VVRLTDIVLVKSDPIINQSSIRAIQIIRSLRKKYSIIALGWQRQSKLEYGENDNLEMFNLRRHMVTNDLALFGYAHIFQYSGYGYFLNCANIDLKLYTLVILLQYCLASFTKYCSEGNWYLMYLTDMV